MDARAIKILFAAGLVSASATLGPGCAGIIGADFDRSFSEGGGAGGAGGASASSSAVSTGGAGGAGGASSTSSTSGTGGPVADCPAEAGQSKDRCTVHVFVKLSTIVGMDPNTTTDAIMTLDAKEPNGFAPTPTSTFTLSKASSASEDTALFACVQAQDGTHTLTWGASCTDGKLLGYMSSNSVPGYDPLFWLTTGNGLGAFDNKRALIGIQGKPGLCDSTPPYGGCEVAPFFVLK